MCGLYNLLQGKDITMYVQNQDIHSEPRYVRSEPSFLFLKRQCAQNKRPISIISLYNIQNIYMRYEADCVTCILEIFEPLKTKIVHFVGRIDKILICLSESTDKWHFLLNKNV